MSQLDLFDGPGCLLCGAREKLEVHHVDWHHEHNGSTNKVGLCKSCHVGLHKAGYYSVNDIIDLRERLLGCG